MCDRLELFITEKYKNINRLLHSYLFKATSPCNKTQAYTLTLHETESGRSLMYSRNNVGPRTDPCGTPELTGASDSLALTATFWNLPERNS